MSMMLKNPITGTEYETEEGYVESLIEEYKRVKKVLYQDEQDEKSLVEAFRALYTGDETHGTFTFNGTKQKVKVALDTNVTYEKPRGGEHPLRRLLQTYPELYQMIRVEYKESGSTIEGLVSRFTENKLMPGDNAELAAELVKVRKENPAKPKISVEDRVDIMEGSSNATT